MSSLSKYLLVGLLLPATGFAGNKVGNGGNAVWCKDGKPEARLLDFYEAGLTPAEESGTPEAIAGARFDKLRDVAPKLAAQYRKRLAALPAEIEIKADAKLTPIPDSQHAFEPLSADCKVEQLAIRRLTIVDGEKRFLLRGDLWEKLGAVDRAGLYVHEIIYEHLSKLGESDSIKARKLNAFLFDPKVEAKHFWKRVRELELPIYP